jgi:hypothetical protein
MKEANVSTEKLELQESEETTQEEGAEEVTEEFYSPSDALRDEYNARVNPLKENKESLEKEKMDFLFSSKREIEQIEARIGLTDVDILKLKAEGKFEKADEKKNEQAQLQTQLESLRQQQTLKISELDYAISEVEREMVRQSEITKNIFVRDFEVSAQRLLLNYVVFVEKCWGALSGFAMTTKCKLSRTVDRQRLGIHPSGSDENKRLYQLLKEWIY